MWDSPALFREPWVTLGAMARETERVRLGTWVTNPLSRHPVVTASAAASVDDLAPGRVYIGIGAGGTGVWHLGMKTASLAMLEEYVVAVRQLLAEGEAEYRGETVRLPWAAGRRIPIVVSAHGPQALRVAGRVGDGVIVGLGVTPEVVTGSLELLEEGARSAGRSAADLDVWFTCFWFVDEEPGVAAQRGAWAGDRVLAPLRALGRRGPLRPARSCRTGWSSSAVPTTSSRTARFRPSSRSTTRAWPTSSESASTYGDDSSSPARPTRSRSRSAPRSPPAPGSFDGAIDADLPEHRERITSWARLVLPRFRDA